MRVLFQAFAFEAIYLDAGDAVSVCYGLSHSLCLMDVSALVVTVLVPIDNHPALNALGIDPFCDYLVRVAYGIPVFKPGMRIVAIVRPSASDITQGALLIDTG
ncbi:hypothetical protein ABIC09_006438 [Bradyrhizobium sp. S3.12.5]